MYKAISTLFIIVCLLVVVSCNDTPTSVEQQHQHAKAAEQPVSDAKATELNDNLIHAIYSEYLQLTHALVQEQTVQARIFASNIETAAKLLGKGAPIAKAASAISSSGELEIQREAFQNLTDAMTILIKNSGVKQGQVYVQHCPMAFNDKGGSWLSNSPDIVNPYFGDEMLNCGSVTDTLK